eukprot:COSAG01_NODE_215_length_21709_cov_141.101217_26_plen_45_part_00
MHSCSRRAGLADCRVSLLLLGGVCADFRTRELVKQGKFLVSQNG